MASAIVLDGKMAKKEELALPESYEAIHSHNLYVYVKAYLSNVRSGTAHAKTRAEVSGTGKKPFAQKGGGRARQGSFRAPQFRGGGVTFGPRSERNYYQKVNKKQKKLALRFALNDKAQNGKLFLVDSLSVASGKTKDAAAMVKALGAKDVLVVTHAFDEKSYLAFRNLPNCYFIDVTELNAYLASAYRAVLMTKDAFETIVKEG